MMAILADGRRKCKPAPAGVAAGKMRDTAFSRLTSCVQIYKMSLIREHKENQL